MRVEHAAATNATATSCHFASWPGLTLDAVLVGRDRRALDAHRVLENGVRGVNRDLHAGERERE